MDHYKVKPKSNHDLKRISQCAAKLRTKEAVNLPSIALAFLLGVCALQLQPDLQIPIWTQADLLAFLPLMGLIFYYRPDQRVFMALILGYLWALLFAHSYLQQRLENHMEGQEILIKGRVVGLVIQGEQSARFNFVIDEYESITDLNRQNMPHKIRLSWYRNKHVISSGEYWQLLVKLKAPHGTSNPNSFDYEKWLYQQGIHATGYVRKSADNKLLNIGGIGLNVNSSRQAIQRVISQLPDQSNSALLQALSIGDKSQITARQWQVLIASGTSHLLAISGLHIGLVAGLVFFIMRKSIPARLIHPISGQQYAVLASIFVGGIYTALAGFSVPTQRAFIMLLVVMLAVLLKRPAFSFNTLSLALLAVLIIDPISVLGVGFWLSFSAVILISLIVNSRSQRQSSLYKAVTVQWQIAMAMLPLSVLLFQQGSLISPLANMFMIPLVGILVIPLALVASFMNIISINWSIWLFALAGDLVGLGWQALVWMVQLPVATWQQPVVPILYAVLALLGGVLLLFPRGFPLRYTGGVLLLPMLLYVPEKPARNDFWLTILDVGQGLSILIRTHENALLYDSGAKYGERYDIGQQVIVPYLRTVGVKQLDMLMISHADNDHAGGASTVIEQVGVKRILLGGGLNDFSLPHSAHAVRCEAGDKWQWDGVLFEVLNPVTEYIKTNNKSCVLRVSNKQKSVLLTGDIERLAELNMLKFTASQISSDVLIVPHHGSNTSSSLELLKSVNPQLAVVSAGYKNRFRHPTKNIESRYKERHIEMLNTAYEGAIQLKFSENIQDGQIEVKRQRKEQVHYWNHRF